MGWENWDTADWVGRGFIVLVLAVALFFGADCACGRDENWEATVTGHTFEPGYVTYTYISDGKGGGCMSSTYIPPSYYTYVRLDRGDSRTVNSRWAYGSTPDGIRVKGGSRIGRFTGGANVNWISKVYR